MSQKRGLAANKLEDWVWRRLVCFGRQCSPSFQPAIQLKWRKRQGPKRLVHGGFLAASLTDEKAKPWFVISWPIMGARESWRMSWVGWRRAKLIRARAKPGHTKAPRRVLALHCPHRHQPLVQMWWIAPSLRWLGAGHLDLPRCRRVLWPLSAWQEAFYWTMHSASRDWAMDSSIDDAAGFTQSHSPRLRASHRGSARDLEKSPAIADR
jgi:hypothetical protein